MDPYILCFGLPGSGKSTTAKLLKSKLDNYHVFNIRDIRVKLGMHPFISKEGEEEQIKKYLQDYDNIIFDRIAGKEKNRFQCYRIASKHYRDILAIWHDLPNEIAEERIRKRKLEYEEQAQLKHNDPRLRKEYEIKWSNPLLDLKNPKNSHVSMIKFNTHLNLIERIKVKPSMAQFVDKIEKILLNI